MEPSASMATRTCRKAGARDKHTGDAETTPCSARGEEERFEQAPGKRPEERTGLLDSGIQSRHRQSGGRPPSRNCKRKPLQNPDQEPWSDNDSKGKGKGKKWEASSQAAALTTHKGSRQQGGNRGGRTPKGEHPLSPPRAKTTVNIREAAFPEETRQAQDEPNRRPAKAATA